MAPHMLTIAWGWDGMSAAAGFLVLALTCGAVLFLLDDDDLVRRPAWRDLACEWRAWLAVAIGLVSVGAAIDEVWGATHVSSIALTVSGLEEEFDDGDDLYYVNDTQGRRFTVREPLYRRLHEGDRVECDETRPLIRRSALLSCERRTAR